MTGKGNVSKASVLRIVTSAELKRLTGSRPKMGWGAGLGDVNGRPTHVQSPPGVKRGLNPVCGSNLRNGEARLPSRPGSWGPSRPTVSTGKGAPGKGRGGAQAEAA